jgi:outer membrane protein assembly factor BamB
MTSRLAALPATLLGLLLAAPSACAADWPTWRYDANRTAASPQKLPDKLHVHWVRHYPPLKTAWPDQPKMQFDAAYEPIVLGKTLFIGSSRHDCVTALDTATGQEKWRFFADGPVRFAPAAWEGKVYFTSDDGYLYCLDAAKGSLLWKFRGGPNDRKILGNERLISTWPARGAPVIADGTVYFAASIWPFMGTFIHALDARTGQVRWTNDGDGSIYIKQPHNADSFAGVAPQGYLVAIGDKLLIPGGRSVPACYDRITGKLLRYQLAENGKKGGGYDVMALGNLFLNGGAVFDLETQKHLAESGKQAVLTDDVLYAYASGALRAFDLKNAGIKEAKTVDRFGTSTKTKRWLAKELASLKLPVVDALIRAGSRLYAGVDNQVLAIDLTAGQEPGIIWKASVEGEIARLIAADDRLFAVTYEGQVYCFGAEQGVPRQHPIPKTALPQSEWTARIKQLLDTVQIVDGYAVVWGAYHTPLACELAAQSRLHVIVIERDVKLVQSLREKLIAAGLYGERVEVHQGGVDDFVLPPYLASLMIYEDCRTLNSAEKTLQMIYAGLRPYGGKLCLLGATAKVEELAKQSFSEGLPNARWTSTPEMVVVTREGALPGSANWTHEHADAANTRVSKDRLVKAPLGLLWFGGPSHEGILPRHGHGPQPQVLDGRLIIEGIDFLRAIDIYTGRLLWETHLPGVGIFYNNLAHQPGANASGTNYISTADGIYVAYGNACLRLDPATGKKTGEFKLPLFDDNKQPPKWGYLNVYQDYLIGGADPLFDPKLLPNLAKMGSGDDPEPGKKPAKDDLLTKLLKSLRGNNDNLSSSKHLVVMDRHTGKVLWSVTAENGFRHNATCVGGGRLHTIDRLSGPQLAKLKRRGEEPATQPRLLVFDLKSGKELWSTRAEIFGTWLSYSAKHDVLVEAGRFARDTMFDEPKGVRTYQADSGKVLWYEPSYVGPAMIHGDTLLVDTTACDLVSGKQKMRPDPLTGSPVPWKWTRNYGCNTPAASEHLLTFRSGAAGYFDLCHDGGTGNFGGFRSSCTNNLIVAGGVLTAPDYTRTCSCSYQNQTSLALVHMAEAEMWTFLGSKDVKGPIRRLGINLGAPGDRRANDGTLWLEHPSVAGASPVLDIKTMPATPDYFRRHSSQVSGPLNWVAASGVKGLTSLRVVLDKDGDEERTFTVRLHFVEPDNLKPGQRVFSVHLQGREVLKTLDIAKEAGGPNRALVKEFAGIRVTDELTIHLTPSVDAEVAVAVLCGLEVIEEARK